MATVFASYRTAYGYTAQSEVDNSGSITDVCGTQAGPYSQIVQIDPGTAAYQADRAFRDSQILANSSVTYTLSSLPGGVSMARVRLLVVDNLTINSVNGGPGGSITVGPGSTNGWTNGLGGPFTALPGSTLVLPWPDATGIVVAAGSNDQITLTGTGTYRICLLGCSV